MIAHRPFPQVVLCAALLSSGCSSRPLARPPVSAAPSVPAAVKEAPVVDSPVPGLPPEAVTDATLSYLEPDTAERCRWVQHTPPGEPRTVLILPVPCSQGIGLAWSPDGREALLSYWTVAESKQDTLFHLWRVDLTTLHQTALPVPTLGSLTRHGFDARGRVVVLTSDPFSEEEEGQDSENPSPHITRVTQGEGREQKDVLLFEGQPYALSEDGAPGLAHTLQYEEGAWKRIETASTYYDTDFALGVDALKMGPTLKPTLHSLNAEARGGPFVPVAKRAPVLRRLPRKASKDGLWHQCATPQGFLYVNRVGKGPRAFLEAPVYLQGAQGPERVPVPDVEDGEDILLSTRGELLLVLGGGEDTYHTRLWSLKARRPVASLEGKHDVVFWPRPAP